MGMPDIFQRSARERDSEDEMDEEVWEIIVDIEYKIDDFDEDPNSSRERAEDDSISDFEEHGS